MEQTAVEWLQNQLKDVKYNPLEKNGYSIAEERLFNQAKEMEKQKQGYSEEELKSAFKIGFNIGYGSPVQELDLKNEHCEKWFKQFKKQ